MSSIDPGTNLYDRLELSPSATRSEIRASYHRLAKLCHPDKNPGADPATFQALQQAYEVLSDPEKRASYDSGPSAASDPSFTSPSSSQTHFHRFNFSHDRMFDDLFTRMFRADLSDPFFSSSFDPFARRHRPPHHRRPWPRPATAQNRSNSSSKSPDSKLDYVCTLEDLMTGRKVMLDLQRQLSCEPCRGHGFKLDAQPRACSRCDGQGFIFNSQSINGLFTCSRTTCSSCGGEGSKLSSQDRCAHCKGRCLQVQRQTVEWKLSKGMLPEQKVPIPGMGDAKPGCSPGDLILTLKLAPHLAFTLVSPTGRDLLLSVSITLSESLLGLDRVLFHHLDGRAIRVCLPPPHLPGHTVIKPGEIRVIRLLGLPGRNGQPSGDLWIKFEIEWPTAEWVRSQDSDFLRQSLPPARPDFIPTLLPQNPQCYVDLEQAPPDEQAAKLGDPHVST